APEELARRYWHDIEELLTKLERSFGQISKLYHEANFMTGDEGLKNVQRINGKGSQMITGKVEKGARVEALEDKENFFEIFDCQLFLSMRFASKNVLEKLAKTIEDMMDVYEAAIQKRRAHIPQQILNTLKEGETGILMMREEERIKIQFPSEVNVILVMPPVYNEIEKWEREHQHHHGQG
ncbi:hypothetical protein WDW89_06905, partial [Deltaproteobacteria bacterium TL4]